MRPNNIYGLAADIGTTTVVVSLLDLRDGSEVGAKSAINPQTRHGADVLSRIAYSLRHGAEGVDTLRREIAAALGELGIALCLENGVDPRAVREIAAAGNTTMLHLLLGVDPGPMGFAPFVPVFTESRNVRAPDAGLPFEEARLCTLPSASAWIGADVVAGLYVCGVGRQKGNILFIDIGTNGEIVLARGGELLACSCAAGPAFEGMNVACGMRAAKGAVEDVALSPEGGVQLTVIGNVPPVALCGSGVLAAVRELLRVGLLRRDGSMLKEADLPPGDARSSLCRLFDGKPAVLLADGNAEIVFTQKDVRQVQLAKGAILSGFRALLQAAGIEMENLDRVLTAGQFGAHLPVKSLTACGILPDALSHKIEYAGNSALAGARAALLSPASCREMDALARTIRTIDLAELEEYGNLFMECLEFPGAAPGPQALDPLIA